MEFKVKLFSILFIFFISANVSYSQNLINHIPKDATLVVKFNPNFLNSKVNLNQLSEFDFYDTMLKEASKGVDPAESNMIFDVLKNPSSYGMDFMSNSYFYIQTDGKATSFAYLFKLTDGAKFENLFNDVMGKKEEMEISDKGTYKTAENNGMAVSWSNNMVVIANTEVQFDWDSEESYEDRALKARAITQKKVSSLMSGYGTQSILSHPQYALINTKKNDVSVWLDYGYFGKMYSEMANYGGGYNGNDMEEIGMKAMMDAMQELYTDSYLTMDLNFNEGAMDIDYKVIANKKMNKLIKGMMDKKPNKKFCKYIKGDELLGYMSMSYNVEEMAKGMKDMFLPMMNEIPMYGAFSQDALDILDIFIDEESIYNLFTGDIALAVTGIREFETTVKSYEFDEDFNSIETEKKVMQKLPEVTMLMSYGNKKDIMKFVKLAKKMDGLVDVGNNAFKIQAPDMPLDVYVGMNDGILFFTNSPDLVQNRLAIGYPKSQRMSKALHKKFKKSNYNFFWDISQSIDAASTAIGIPPGSSERIANSTKQTFSNMIMSSSKPIGNVYKYKISLNFKDEKTNAIKQFFNFINEMYFNEMGGLRM